MAKKEALGKGLGALIDESNNDQQAAQTDANAKAAANSYVNIPVNEIENNPFQPRKEFDDESIQQLAESMKRLGIIQPITVRKPEDENSEYYQLISGERRLKAAKIAEMSSIPAFIRKADDQAMLEFSLVENIQREDLNSMEIAITYKRLIDECEVTQDNLSKRVGKKRSTITNYLRLLKLPPDIQIGIRDGRITMGHARSLINIEDSDEQLKVFNRILKEGLSVRKVEEIVKKINNPESKTKNKSEEAELPERYQHFATDLSQNLNSKIQLKRNSRGKGKIVIPFKSDKDLERLMDLFQYINNENNEQGDA